jgi:plasmid replication initiation protein
MTVNKQNIRSNKSVIVIDQGSDLVRFSNELIKTPHSLDSNERNVVLYLLSKINGYQPNPGVIRFSAEDYADKLNLISTNGKGTYPEKIGRVRRTVKTVLNTLYDKSFKRIYLDEQGAYREEKVHWINKLDTPADNESGDFIVEFSTIIEPYLFNLSSNYSEFELTYLPRENEYAFKLYQILLKRQFLRLDGVSFKEDTVDGKFVYFTTIDLQALKNILSLGGKYADWKDFKKRVLVPALAEINAKSRLSVSYDPLRVMRSIKQIRFTHIIENEVNELAHKPLRPRLARRPSVKADSHAEGEWKKKNYLLLQNYRERLKSYDPQAELNKLDLERLSIYSELFNRKIHTETKSILDSMREKKKARPAKK